MGPIPLQCKQSYRDTLLPEKTCPEVRNLLVLLNLLTHIGPPTPSEFLSRAWDQMSIRSPFDFFTIYKKTFCFEKTFIFKSVPIVILQEFLNN